MKTAVVLAGLLALGGNGSFQTSQVWVDGTSTVRRFKCSATEIISRVGTTEAADIAGIVEHAAVTIPVSRLDCGNGKMNEHMRNALKADRNANIEFDLSSYEVDGTRAVLNGTLTMSGTVRGIQIPAIVTREDDVIRVKASVPLKMTQWGIKPPSLMLGAMKVREDVTVGFDVTLKP